MKVLIAHKDVTFLLTKIQQEFIFDFNNFSLENLKNKKARIFPLFPLWAFFDDSENFDLKNLCKSQIEKIDFENEKFYFSIKLDFFNSENFEQSERKELEETSQIKSGNFSKTLKIYFAQILENQTQNFSDFSLKEFIKKFNQEFFPIKMNVFKIGNVTEKNSLLEVFDEKWIKISSK